MYSSKIFPEVKHYFCCKYDVDRESIYQRFDLIEAQLNVVTETPITPVPKFAQIDSRLDLVETQLVTIRSETNVAHSEITKLEKEINLRLDNIEHTNISLQDKFNAQMSTMHSDIESIEQHHEAQMSTMHSDIKSIEQHHKAQLSTIRTNIITNANNCERTFKTIENNFKDANNDIKLQLCTQLDIIKHAINNTTKIVRKHSKNIVELHIDHDAAMANLKHELTQINQILTENARIHAQEIANVRAEITAEVRTKIYIVMFVMLVMFAYVILH